MYVNCLINDMTCSFSVKGLSVCVTSHILLFQLTFLASEPGVPYNVTVRARSTIGKGELLSIVVFAGQQGNINE